MTSCFLGDIMYLENKERGANVMLNKLDRVIVTKKEIGEIFKWKDENKELVRNYKPILLEGIIEHGRDIFIHFKHDKNDCDNVRYRYYFKETKLIDFKYDRNTWIVSNEWFNKDIGRAIFKSEQEQEGIIKDILSIHSSLMAFVENFETEIVVREERENKKGKAKSKSRKNKAKKGGTSKLIKKRVYTIPKNIKEVLDGNNKDKRGYARQVDEWTRRGHWRKYRDNEGKVTKKVWINQIVCKSNGKVENKVEKTGKTYTLGIDNTDTQSML